MFLENISNFIFNSTYENASEETIRVVKAAFLDFSVLVSCLRKKNLNCFVHFVVSPAFS